MDNGESAGPASSFQLDDGSMNQFWREYAESYVPDTTSSLNNHGVTRGRLAGPRWRRTSRGRYVQATDGSPVTAAQRIVQAWAQLPPGSAIGGWAAAYALGVTALDGRDPLTMKELPITAVVPSQLHRVSRADLRYVRDRLPAGQTFAVEGMRFTRELRTAFDLARWAPDLVESVVALDAVLAGRVITQDRLERAAAAWPSGKRGVRQARRAVELSRPRTRSQWETRLRLVYVLDLGFPTPSVNPPVFDRDGKFLGAPDLLDEYAGLAMEFDGAGHRDRDQHRVDNVREEGFERAGLLVVRTDSKDMQQHRIQLRRRLCDARADGLRRDPSRDRWTTEAPPNWLGMPI